MKHNRPFVPKPTVTPGQATEEDYEALADWKQYVTPVHRQAAITWARQEYGPAPERFPVQIPPAQRAMFGGLRSVPWATVAPFEGRAQRNHGQSLRRLAIRGGLSPRELFCLLADETFRFESIPLEEQARHLSEILNPPTPPSTGVYQTIIDTERGNCEAACVATLLDLQLHEVPNFADPDTPTNLRLREWIHTQGHGIVELSVRMGPDAYVYTGLEGLVAIATVPSQAFEGSYHAILVGWRAHPDYEGALECYVVHDPNPNNKPYEDVEDKIVRLRWIVPHANRSPT